MAGRSFNKETSLQQNSLDKDKSSSITNFGSPMEKISTKTGKTKVFRTC
jgi:hypothetical protein